MPEFGIEGDVNLAGSRIIVPVALATILAGAVVTVTGTVTATAGGSGSLGGTVVQAAAQYAFTNTSAVIKSSPGTLYQVLLAGASGTVAGAGTLLVLDGSATVAVLPVAAGGFQSAPFGPGVGFGTLIASLIGSGDATFVFR